jgi:hypothetical protein
MRDDPELPFYSPHYRPPQATRNRPAERLWTVHFNHVTWSRVLRFHGESYGWETLVFRDGELFSRRGAFVAKVAAVQWGEELRKGAETGFLEDF